MSKITTKGTVLSVDTGSGHVAVAQITGHNGPNVEVQFYDATALDSGVPLEDGTPTGHVAVGEVSGEMFLDPGLAIHQTLRDYLVDPENSEKEWKITYSDNSTETFNGILAALTPKVGANDGVRADFRIKLTSLPTYSP